MDQADKGEDLGWGCFYEWAFFCPEDFTTTKRQGKLHPEFILSILLWCILHINVSE